MFYARDLENALNIFLIFYLVFSIESENIEKCISHSVNFFVCENVAQILIKFLLQCISQILLKGIDCFLLLF